MKHYKNRRAQRRTPRAQWLFDDGVDVIREKRSREAGKSGHKTYQLCKQAQRALSLALADCGDPLLQSLYVQTVEGAPDASRLRVIVACEFDDPLPAAQIVARLEYVGKFLRQSVARAIVRKRSPQLVFTVAPRGKEGL